MTTHPTWQSIKAVTILYKQHAQRLGVKVGTMHTQLCALPRPELWYAMLRRMRTLRIWVQLSGYWGILGYVPSNICWDPLQTRAVPLQQQRPSVFRTVCHTVIEAAELFWLPKTCWKPGRYAYAVACTIHDTRECIQHAQALLDISRLSWLMKSVVSKRS